MAAKAKHKRFDCAVDPCPRKKPKYFIKHTDHGVTLTREELMRAQAYFGDSASVNLSVNVMCDAHLERYRQLRGQPARDGGDHASGDHVKPRRKEHTCSKCGQPKKSSRSAGHVCAGDSRSGSSSAAALSAPILTPKETRVLIQQLKPTLGKRKAEPHPFSKHTAARSLFHIATDEQLKRGVRHDVSVLTRFFTNTVPFREPGPYEVPPGPFVPNPAAPQPQAQPAPMSVLAALASRKRSHFNDAAEPIFERYPIEEDLRDIYRRHHAEIAEDLVDQ